MSWRLAFVLIASGLILFVAVAGPTALIFEPADIWADFIKVVLVLPGPTPASGPLHPLVERYIHSSDYDYVGGIFHLPPLSLLTALAARWIFAFLSPVVLYLALAFALLSAFALLVYRYCHNLLAVAALIISYPLIAAFERGNLFSICSAPCVVAALVRRRPDWPSAIFFALAINIRPNVVFCALPLVVLDKNFAWKLAVASGAMLASSFFAVRALIPGYEVETFLAGLSRYSSKYVGTDLGALSGSSLPGALVALHLEYLIPYTAILLAVLPVAAIAFHRKCLGYDEFAFVCANVTALLTPTFADYHLLIFAAPLILARSLTVAVPSVLLMIPKGYFAVGPFTIQVLLNPLIMLIATGAMLWLMVSRMLASQVGEGGAPASTLVRDCGADDEMLG